MNQSSRFAVLAIVLLSACSLPICFAREASQPIVIEHATVIDATGRAPLPDQTVVIRNGVITSVGPFTKKKLPQNALVIDARGKFLIPGLWDMHTHLAGVSADPAWSKKVLLPLLLAYGITGVRDMGGDLEELQEWRREIEAGSMPGPHIVTSGPWLSAAGKRSPEQFPVANAEEARAAVRELKRRGADFIKVISIPSREAFLAVADEAKKQNLPLVGHLPFEIGAAEASAAGMRSIEHILYSALALSFSSEEEELRKRLVAAEKTGDSAAWESIALQAQATYSAEKAAALWQVLQKNDTWITPTLASMGIASHPDQWHEDDPLLALVPLSLAKEWREAKRNERTKSRAAWLARQVQNESTLTREMHRQGIPLLAGSDCLDMFVFCGASLHEELAQLVQAGLTPMELLQTVTRGAAKFLGKEKEFGAIEPGKHADLVLLSANPLLDIHNSQKVFSVIRDGVHYDRAALDGMLEKAKSAAAEAGKP